MSDSYEGIKKKEKTGEYILLSAMYPESDEEEKRWNLSDDWDCGERYRFEYKTINKNHESILNAYMEEIKVTLLLSETDTIGKLIHGNDFIENYEEDNFYKLKE